MSKGFPITFRCTSCRSTVKTVPSGQGRAASVKLTGRTRPHYSGGRYRNVMATGIEREYVCACGHTGWSCHRDLETKAARQP